jgi:hypothetical protein
MKLSDFYIKPKTYIFYRIKTTGGTIFENENFKGYRRSKLEDRLLSKTVFHRLGSYR